ncbi:MAG TPA: four helix bundle protein [Lacipirellulaceae bacterium]
MFRFEKLDVWHRAIEHARQVYSITQSFPDNERFGLTSQLRRAAVSVSANIAEGSGRSSDVDFARFIEISYGSLMEVVSHASIAKLQGLLSNPAFDTLYQQSDELARMLSGLRSTLTQRQSRKRPASGSRPSTLDS